MSQSRKFSLSSGMAFLVLFVLLMLCCSSGALVHAGGAELSDSVELFVGGETKVPYKVKTGIVWRSEGWGFHVPYLVEVDGLMVAISEAAMGYGSGFTVPSEVVSLAMEMSKLKGKDWKSGVPKTSDEEFVPQAVFNHSKTQLRSHMRIERPSVIVKGKKIYVYAGKFDTEAERSQRKAIEETWEPLLVVGEVRESGSEQKKTIVWQKPVSLAASLEPQLKVRHSLYQRIDGGGAGVAMEDGTLVFPVEAKDKRGRTISLIIYSKDDGANWTVSEGATLPDCSDPSILEWKRGTLLMVAKCDPDYRCMFESNDMGNTWMISPDGPLPRIWNNHVIEAKRDIRDAYINATIDGERVILVTLPASQKGSGKATQLQLWATDMKNVKAIGPIAKAASDVKSSALLYTHGELFSLHERGKEHGSSLFLTKLDSQLEQIKAAVREWKKSDVLHAHPYISPALRHYSLSWNCKPRVLENGLIGFLSSNTSESYWENERGHHEGATVRKADRVPCGFRFHGYGTGALWTVSTAPKDGQQQFTGDTFTLVANVQIHRNLYDDHPLLSVDLAPGGRKRLLGLLYTAHGNWMPRYGPTRRLVPATWELQRVYQVIMTVQNGQGFIYVDGEPLPGSGTNVSLSKEQKSKMYFYFGGYPVQTSTKDIDVTVTNVLLYNRTMNASEIEELSRKIEVEKTPEEKEETVLSGDVDDTEEELTKSNDNWKDEHDEGSLPLEGNSIDDEEEPIEVPPIFPTRKLSEGNSTNIAQGEATHSQLNNETGKDSRGDYATENKQLFSAKNQTTHFQKGEKMMSWSVLHDSAVRGYAGQTLVVFLLGFAVLC